MRLQWNMQSVNIQGKEYKRSHYIWATAHTTSGNPCDPANPNRLVLDYAQLVKKIYDLFVILKEVNLF